MTRSILGLDIGGANLKAATPDGRAVSVPFALWKQPDRLPAALAELVGRFPDVGELAVTMTGELCDCYETKRQGVNSILDAVEHAAAGRPVRVWGTGGEFQSEPASRADYMTVAAANWHALATFAGRLSPHTPAILIDIGSTTSDLIPIFDGLPAVQGVTDESRLMTWELVYTGVRRTPVCIVPRLRVAAELFATSLDVYLTLDLIADDPYDCDTADGRPATKIYAHGRLSRMLGGDSEQTDAGLTRHLAEAFARHQVTQLADSLDAIRASTNTRIEVAILAGAGEFLGRQILTATQSDSIVRIVSLTETLGSAVSACAPAFAVAILASERPS